MIGMRMGIENPGEREAFAIDVVECPAGAVDARTGVLRIVSWTTSINAVARVAGSMQRYWQLPVSDS